MKKCPFKYDECTNECALYVNFEELNELVVNRLRSLGVFTKGEGICSMKIQALAQGRFIFENTKVYK